MEDRGQLFDICIVCALHEEASAVLDEISTRCAVSFSTAFSHVDYYTYRHTTIQNKDGEPLTVLVTWLADSGPVRTGLDLKPFLQEFRPRFVAMTGFCAGYQGKVRLGDLVVAECAYHYEEGKILSKPDGQTTYLPEAKMAYPTSQVIQYAKGFDNWREPVIELMGRLLKRPASDVAEPACHIAAMASGMAVRGDNPFPRLIEHHHRKTFALDMEAATFYLSLHAFPHIHALVVKGVCDYADISKNDIYHDYAARASAVYLLSFIQEHVNGRIMPRRDAPNAEPSGVWNVPLPRNPFFTGQEALLAQIADILQIGGPTILAQSCAISGLGGIGKTRLAVEYAYRHRQRYQAVLWCRADTREALVSSYVALAKHLHLPEQDEQDRVLTVQAVIGWLSKHAGWLLILDNVDDLSLLDAFLPFAFSGHLLLTTRVRATGKLAFSLVVDAMERDTGAVLLLRRARLIGQNASLETAAPADIAIARAISEELGGLPLALDQAGAYIEETCCSLSAYRERYHSHRPALLKRRGGSAYDYPAPVATTWSLSFARVQQRSPAAADLLRCCALLYPDAIPEELFSLGAIHLGTRLQRVVRDPLAFDEVAQILLDYSLIRRNPTTAMLSIHRLVQAVLLDSMPARTRKLWRERVLLAVNEAFPEWILGELTSCERLLPHALECASWIGRELQPTVEAARLLNQAGVYLRERALYTEAEPLLEQATSIRQQYLGDGHHSTATSLHHLALLYDAQGKYSQAEPLYQSALAIYEQQLGHNHPDTQTVHGNYMSLLLTLGHTVKALDLQEPT